MPVYFSPVVMLLQIQSVFSESARSYIFSALVKNFAWFRKIWTAGTFMHSMLGEEQAAKVVETVQTKLVAGPGIRSLSPDHKAYHPIYLGALQKRDEAYHQGTAWGFLMGGFISAYVKVHGHTPKAKKQALAFLEPVREHLYEGCIGSISEIFDGDSPHTCRGCHAQAWSVGEVLRCYVEDILD